MQFQTDELEFVQLADGFFLLLFFFYAPGTFQHSSRSVTYFRFHCSCSRQTCWVVGGEPGNTAGVDGENGGDQEM